MKRIKNLNMKSIIQQIKIKSFCFLLTFCGCDWLSNKLTCCDFFLSICSCCIGRWWFDSSIERLPANHNSIIDSPWWGISKTYSGLGMSFLNVDRGWTNRHWDRKDRLVRPLLGEVNENFFLLFFIPTATAIEEWFLWLLRFSCCHTLRMININY